MFQAFAQKIFNFTLQCLHLGVGSCVPFIKYLWLVSIACMSVLLIWIRLSNIRLDLFILICYCHFQCSIYSAIIIDFGYVMTDRNIHVWSCHISCSFSLPVCSFSWMPNWPGIQHIFAFYHFCRICMVKISFWARIFFGS